MYTSLFLVEIMKLTWLTVNYEMFEVTHQLRKETLSIILQISRLHINVHPVEYIIIYIFFLMYCNVKLTIIN